jgi:glyoxylase-like metal-dependent hydrolase (beta-lactamase superfamily II)
MTRKPSFLSSALSRRDALKLLGIGGAAAAFAPRLFSAGSADAPPSLAGPQPHYYRFHMGDLEAVALLDGEISGSLKDMAWWVNVPEAQLSTTLQSAFEAPNEIRLAFTVMLVRTGNELLLIDSGCGPLFGPIGGKLISSLAAIGIKPEQITTVLVSHLHGDHFGGLLDGEKRPVFPNARLLVNEREHAFWSQASPDVSAVAMPDAARRQAVDNAHAYLTALKDRWHFVKPGETPVPGVEIIDAPGHTPGHIAALLGQGDQRVLHLADAAHHHAISFEHPEWKFVADVQPEVAQQTRRTLLGRAARERLRVFGAHLPFPALGHVRAASGHFEYVIEPWAGV